MEKKSLNISRQFQFLRLSIVIVLAAAIYFGLQNYLNQIAFNEKLDEIYESIIQSEQSLNNVQEAKSIELARIRIAAEQTAAYIDENMDTTDALENPFKLLDHSLNSVNPNLNGYYAEFGVYKGTTINYIASKIDMTIHGFDSFEGLPEDWRTEFKKGHFKMEGLPEVAENVELHKGWFDTTVAEWAENHPGPMQFIHFDADLYSSTKTVLDVLSTRIVPGTVIQFDEFFNYPGWQKGEYKAFMEFVADNDVSFEFIGYSIGGTSEQVAIRIMK